MFSNSFTTQKLVDQIEATQSGAPRHIISLLSLLILLFTAWSVLESRKKAPYPPGPKRLPLLGNLHNFPKKDLFRVFSEWRHVYGDIVYVKILRTPVILINSVAVAEELCSKKASSYSFRPVNYFTNRMFGYTWSVAAMQPGHLHSAIRRVFRESIGPQSVTKYDPFIQREAHNMIVAYQAFEGNPWTVITSIIGRVVVTLAYGPTVFKAHGEELIELNRTAIGQIAHLGTKFWLVDYFPSLRHIPAWIPGATFKRIAIEAYKLQARIHHWPWKEVNARYQEGTAGACIAAEYIEKGRDQTVARDAIAVMYMAGVDTTSTTLFNFLYAMAVHPEVQRKVQVEIDSVVGQGRLPHAGDRPMLHYADAAWKESQRWITSVPMSVPHLNGQEDIYRGMRIPKDSKILLNINAMLNDANIFDSPEVYYPERWLETYNPRAKNLPDIHTVFGFGTRICAGRYLAERVGFTFGMSVLAAYDVVPIDGGSTSNRSDIFWEDSGIKRPALFQCTFKPRSSLANVL